MFYENRCKACRPIVCVYNVRKPAEFVANLKGSVTQKRKTVRIVKKIRFKLGAVNTVPSKALFVVQKVNIHLWKARKCCCVNRCPFLAHSNRNAERTFQLCEFFSVNFVVTWHYDTNIMSHLAQAACQGTYCIGKTAGFCKRNCFCTYH